MGTIFAKHRVPLLKLCKNCPHPEKPFSYSKTIIYGRSLSLIADNQYCQAEFRPLCNKILIIRSHQNLRLLYLLLFFQILGRMASEPNLWCCPCSKKPEFKILLSHSQSRRRGHHGVPGTPLECLGGRPIINRSPILVIFWGKIFKKRWEFQIFEWFLHGCSKAKLGRDLNIKIAFIQKLMIRLSYLQTVCLPLLILRSDMLPSRRKCHLTSPNSFPELGIVKL